MKTEIQTSLHKLSNEKAIKSLKNKNLYLKIPIGVNGRWVFEEAKKLKSLGIKTRITL